MAVAVAHCKCGAEVVKAEIRLVGRCSNGHFSSSAVTPSTVSPTALREPITAGQIRGINGKATALDKLHGLGPGQTKRQALQQVGVVSTKDLDAGAASDLLDALEEQLEAADPSGERRASR